MGRNSYFLCFCETIMKFSPSVALKDGRTYTPPNWMWVIGFALGGCDWAIKIADTEDFRTKVRLWLSEQRSKAVAEKMLREAEQLEASMEEFEQCIIRVRALKAELGIE